MQTPICHGNKQMREMEVITNMAINANAEVLLIAPQAIGRSFFFGCSLSASASQMSFRQYMPLAAKQKATAITIADNNNCE
jgi:homoaconitase/3-isopropylmalate dehydratase large subunit